jgi:hypothetical protein
VSAYRIELRSLDGGPTAVASSGAFSVITDRPAGAGGRGLGFNGGQLVDRIAEIPNSIRGTTPVVLGRVTVRGRSGEVAV